MYTNRSINFNTRKADNTMANTTDPICNTFFILS